MFRRRFLAFMSCVSLLGPALAGCTPGSSDSDNLAHATYDEPRVFEVLVVEHEAAFGTSDKPYVEALEAAGLLPASGVEVRSLPSYGREGGVVIERPRVAVAESKDALERFFAGLPAEWRLPASHALRYGAGLTGDAGKAWAAYVVRDQPLITAPDLLHINTTQGAIPGLSIKLTREAAIRFGERSGANVGRRLALVLDGEVLSDPIVREAITGGELLLTVSGSEDDHRALQRRMLELLDAAKRQR